MNESKVYKSGPFLVHEQQLTEHGRAWVELELQVSSGPIRVPVRDDEQQRQTVLRAERLALAAIEHAIVEAREEGVDAE